MEKISALKSAKARTPLSKSKEATAQKCSKTQMVSETCAVVYPKKATNPDNAIQMHHFSIALRDVASRSRGWRGIAVASVWAILGVMDQSAKNYLCLRQSSILTRGHLKAATGS